MALFSYEPVAAQNLHQLRLDLLAAADVNNWFWPRGNVGRIADAIFEHRRRLDHAPA